MSAFTSLIKRDLSLAYHDGAGIGIGIIFYLCLVILFPFGIGPNMKTLSLISPAIIWAGPLLSILLGLEKIFGPDIEDGTFDLYRLSPLPLEMVIAAKASAFWFAFALPLILISPLFSMILGMPTNVVIGCVISLLVGSPALVFLGTICAALTVKLKHAGLLITILAVPFLVPILIFGVTAARAYGSEVISIQAPLLILAALSIFSALLSTFAGARILAD